ncbi:MAG: hypothetical protein H5U40_01730, partial [Polyangiaceae bacterium]|nr:hypothetical protein [Polyangiaceae bacterium]
MSGAPPEEPGSGEENDEQLSFRTKSSSFPPLRVAIDDVPRRSVISDLPPVGSFEAVLSIPVNRAPAEFLDDSSVELEIEAEDDEEDMDASSRILGQRSEETLEAAE